jgi:hypothetical protein
MLFPQGRFRPSEHDSLLALSASSAPSQESSFCALLQPASFHSLHLASGIGTMPREHGRSNRGLGYQRYLERAKVRCHYSFKPVGAYSYSAFHSAVVQGIGIRPAEENWGHDTPEDSSSALPHEQIMPSSLPRQEQDVATSGQVIWNTPPTGHWGYPIVEEAPLMTPIQATTRSSEVTHESSRPQFSKELLVLIMDIRRDVADLLFRHEHLNRRLDFLHDALSGESASNPWPTCRQPLSIISTGHQYPSGGDDADTLGA